MPAAKANDRFTDYQVPTVEEDGNAPFRYRVESSTPGQWYLVDLTDRGGFGACSCIHFQTVANPNWKRHGHWIPYDPGRAGVTECKHLAAAWAHYHLYVTVPMLAGFRDGVTPQNQRACPLE